MSPEASRAASRDPAPVFAALGDATRLRLIERLADGRPRSIVQLAADFPVTRQAVSKHLRVLERAGLVARDRVGRESRFTYVPKPVEDARSYLDEVSRQWDEALLRLKSFVER
jgi:DNA-binding transcriptional ArsR family regulator